MLSNRSTLVAAIDLENFPRHVEALDYLQRINTRLAASKRSEADLARMEELAEKFETAVRANAYLEMSASNRDFHVAIALAGKNTYLAKAYERLLDEGRRILHMHFEYLRLSETEQFLSADHRDMIEAIRRQDVEEADRIAHAHTRQFHDRFMGFFVARYEDFDLSLTSEGIGDA